MNPMSFDLDTAVEHFALGGMVLLLDDPGREGEADLLQAAQFCTGESLNFMIHEARGLVTLALAASRLEELRIPIIEPQYTPEHAPRFAVPVDYTPGVTTGISTYDRAVTIHALLDPQSRPEDFARPGHVFPLAASNGGPGQRAGHTEGAVGLARLAGLYPAVVMCELMDETGRMADRPTMEAFGLEFRIPLVHVADVLGALS